MNQENESRAELHSLLGELCNGTLSDSRHAKLQSLLKADAAARNEYLDYIDLHIDLKRISAPVGDIPVNSEQVLKTILKSPPELELRRTTADPEFSRRSASPQSEMVREIRLAAVDSASARRKQIVAMVPWTILATVAAGLLIMTSPSWLSKQTQFESADSSPPNNTVSSELANESIRQVSHVRLTQVASSKFFGETTPPLESLVPFGHEYALSEGMIELQFPAGASAIIEAPAIFEVSDDARLLMKTGVCSVHAPVGAQGFRVDTLMANVVDLGTRFVLSVSQSGETKIQVVEGEADVFTKPLIPDRNFVSAAIKLHEHQARLIESEERVTAKEIAFEASVYKAKLPDRITSFNAIEDDRGAVDELLTVSVQRDGVEYLYTVDQMIGIDLVHYHGASNAIMVTAKDVVELAKPGLDGPARSRLLDRDRSLCSGLINPGGQTVPLTSDPILNNLNSPEVIGTPGIGFRFQSPITNAAGPDVVLFELQTIVNSERGDAFHVSPLHFDNGLHSHTIRRYDISLTSTQSKYLAPYRLYRVSEIPLSLKEVLENPHFGGPIHAIPAKVLAVGIDLSDLGYPIGARVEGLFLQDAADDSDFFDPVFIAGLPTTP